MVRRRPNLSLMRPLMKTPVMRPRKVTCCCSFRSGYLCNTETHTWSSNHTGHWSWPQQIPTSHTRSKSMMMVFCQKEVSYSQAVQGRYSTSPTVASCDTSSPGRRLSWGYRQLDTIMKMFLLELITIHQFSQSQRRPQVGCLLALSHSRHYAENQE